MTRNLKALGLALVAAFAMSAVVASASSAQTTHTFTSEVDKTTLTASQAGIHRFTTAVGSVECEVATFHGTVVGTSANILTITPHYTTCTFAEEPASVTMNGCDYEFTSDTVDGHAPVRLECTTPGGAQDKVEVHVPSTGCTITVAEQETGRGVTFTNEGSGTTADVMVHATADLNITVDGPFFPCAFIGGTGVYTGTATVKGYDDRTSSEGDHVGISVSTP